MSDPDPIILPEFMETPAKPNLAQASRQPVKKKKPAQKPAKQHDSAWNLFTALLLAGTFFIASLYVLIYTRPELLSQNTPFGFLIARSPTLPMQTLPPQPSASPTPEPTLTPTPEQTTPETPQPTPTTTSQALEATPVDPNTTPQGTPDAISFYPFDVQGQINAIDGTVIDQNHGCNWMGVAGRIQEADGSPVVGVQIHLVGYINGRNRDLLTLSGTGQAFGPGGYEFTLTKAPVRTIDSVWVQLVEQNGLPLSPRIRFNTYEDCSKNLIVINFIKVR